MSQRGIKANDLTHFFHAITTQEVVLKDLRERSGGVEFGGDVEGDLKKKKWKINERKTQL